MKTKLVLIEGLPGTGKSTIAQFVKSLLDRKGIANLLFNEGNLDHPADFEYVACLSEDEFDRLIRKYGPDGNVYEEYVTRKAGDILFPYRKCRQETGDLLPAGFYQELAARDICDGIGMEKYCALCRDRWSAFARSALKTETVHIFECCFLQNPTVILLGRHNADNGLILEYIDNLAAVIQSLDPVLIYLYQDDVRSTLVRVSKERPKEWLDFVIAYVTRQAFGKAHGLDGFDGMVEFFEARRALELEAFERLGFRKIPIDVTDLDWERCRGSIEGFLDGA